jgi:hypothetical protein
MFSEKDVRELVNDLLEEEALVIGGLVAVHEVDDDLIWRLMKNLDVIRGKAMRRIEEMASEKLRESAKYRERPNLKPHPAIEEFLLALRR